MTNIDSYIKDKVTAEINNNKTSATANRNTHNILTITGIALCACSAGVLAVGASVGINLGILIGSISCSIVACAVLLTDRIYDFEKMAINSDFKANALSKELDTFQLKAGIYSEGNEKVFVERCEDIISK